MPPEALFSMIENALPDFDYIISDSDATLLMYDDDGPLVVIRADDEVTDGITITFPDDLSPAMAGRLALLLHDVCPTYVTTDVFEFDEAEEN